MSASERYVQPLTSHSKGTARGLGRLKGKRVLIVGGGQRMFDAATDPIGNGRAMSILFAREGAHVAVADINLASARETAGAIEKEESRAFAIEADVAKHTDIIRMLGEAHEGMGGLDGMVFNVGIFGKLGLAGVTLKEWDHTFTVNLRAPMLCCREGLERMSAGGSIVFISSIAALGAGSQLVSYDASKAGLGGLMRHVALEGFKRGIRSNIVFPGLVDTPNGRIAGAGRPSRGATNIPFGRMTTGWEIAHAVLFFLSDESIYITAQSLAVDSGITGV